LTGAALLSAATGIDPESLPGVALGSPVLLLAERTAALFGIWMVMVVIVVRASRDQLPIEISGRGVRYAESDEVQAKVLSIGKALGYLDGEVRLIREAVLDLREPDRHDSLRVD
jgi:hypothetical protein